MKTNSPLQVQKEVALKTLYIAVLPCFFSVIRGEYSALLGLIFGLIVSLLLFRLKAVNLDKALDMPPGKAENFIRNRYFLNYFIYFVVLVVAHQKTGLNFLATAVGLVLIKFTLIGMAVIDHIKQSWREKRDQFT